MPTYLVETYGANHVDALAEARVSAARAAEVGLGVRYLRTTFLPDEETLLHLFEATSADALRHAARLGALAWDRIAEATESVEP